MAWEKARSQRKMPSNKPEQARLLILAVLCPSLQHPKRTEQVLAGSIRHPSSSTSHSAESADRASAHSRRPEVPDFRPSDNIQPQPQQKPAYRQPQPQSNSLRQTLSQTPTTKWEKSHLRKSTNHLLQPDTVKQRLWSKFTR